MRPSRESPRALGLRVRPSLDAKTGIPVTKAVYVRYTGHTHTRVPDPARKGRRSFPVTRLVLRRKSAGARELPQPMEACVAEGLMGSARRLVLFHPNVDEREIGSQ